MLDNQRKVWEDLAGEEPHTVLKKYRLESGLTQKDIGERMGLKCNGGCSTISDFESGKKKYVSFDFVRRYFTALYPKEQYVEKSHKSKNGYMKDRIMRLNGKGR